MKLLVIAIPIGLLLAACAGRAPSDDASLLPPVAAPDERSLPAFFRLDATATATADDGRVAECFLDWHFELREETVRNDAMLEVAGVHGGEAFRSVLTPDGAGLALHADVFGDTLVRWTQPDVLEIEIPINATGEGRFWQALALLPGTIDADGAMSGTWTCAPHDLAQNGYVDVDLPADGTWTVTPEEGEPLAQAHE